MNLDPIYKIWDKSKYSLQLQQQKIKYLKALTHPLWKKNKHSSPHLKEKIKIES
jgi:hypothetical protein